MDQTHEEMKFLGFFGVFRESFKTISSSKKIFTQITISFILPFTVVFLAHLDISSRWFYELEQSPYRIIRFFATAPIHSTTTYWLQYLLLKLVFFSIFAVVSVLSTSAVVYTVASVYAGRDVNFSKLIKVVPRVWKRLSLTFLSMFLTFFLYNVVAGIIFYILETAVFGSILGFILLVLTTVVYGSMFLWLSTVWQLASVVSVLENAYGFKAMIKAKDLAKGKRTMAITVSATFYLIFMIVAVVYQGFVEFSDVAVAKKVAIGLSALVVFLGLFSLFFVSQTVVYLVCKSYHREAIDKLSLSTYLGAYLGESRPPAVKVGEEIQLGRAQGEGQTTQASAQV